MKFLKGLLLVSVFLIVNSCKNDLKLNAPYKEIPSVYAILTPQDPVQTIRINKVFLGEGDANQMAKVADSVNYDSDELTVMLERFVGGVKDSASKSGAKEIIFGEKLIETKPGAFSTTQRVYTTSERLFTNGKYKLTIKNNRTGNVFTASATAIDSVNGNQGIRPLTTPPNGPVYDFPPGTSLDEYIDYASRNGSILFVPDDNKYGKVYQVVIRNHYYDLVGGTVIYDNVDYAFGNRYKKDARVIGGNTYMETSFKSADYFAGVGAALAAKKPNMNVSGRRMYMAEFLIYTSTQEYVDFLEYAKPSLSFNQNKPLYSNFDNQAALGIFTFRTRCSVKKNMSSTFVNEFAYNKNTCSYMFLRSDSNAWPGCP